MEAPKIEIKEMPSQEILEEFIGQIALGLPSRVTFNIETGTFEVRPPEPPVLWP